MVCRKWCFKNMEELIAASRAREKEMILGYCLWGGGGTFDLTNFTLQTSTNSCVNVVVKTNSNT